MTSGSKGQRAMYHLMSSRYVTDSLPCSIAGRPSILLCVAVAANGWGILGLPRHPLEEDLGDPRAG
jgi:hypothetical protein